MSGGLAAAAHSRFWHESEVPALLAYVGYGRKIRQHMLNASFSHVDPERSLADLKSRSATVSCRTEVCYPFCRKHGRIGQ